MKVIERSFGYYRGAPVMILCSAGRDNKNRYFLKIENLLEYSDTHNTEFMSDMTVRTAYLCKILKIQVPARKQQFMQMMTSMSDTIMGGIDDLVKMPPYREGIDDPTLEIDREWLERRKNETPDIQVRLMQ
jgi:hypothetical protein